MEADCPDTECARSLQLLRETRAGSRPLVVFRRRHAQYISRVNDNVGWLDFGFRQRGLEARHPLRLDRGLVAVEFGDGREELQRRHPCIASTKDGHVDAAVFDGVRADIASHVGRLCKSSTASPPGADAISDSIPGFSRGILARLQPESNLAMNKDDPWYEGWHIVRSSVPPRLEDMSSCARENHP